MHTLFQLLQESTNSLGFSTALHFQGLMFMERDDEMIKLTLYTPFLNSQWVPPWQLQMSFVFIFLFILLQKLHTCEEQLTYTL